ncbi:MAG: ribonuclease HII [Paracoccaceae bacterium]
MSKSPDLTYEECAAAAGWTAVAGVDEVGRGPLCGPVVAAAVILPAEGIPDGLNDSKKLTAAARARLFDLIGKSCAVGVGMASPAEIDAQNILRASHLAMCRALAALPHQPDHALIDGNLLPRGLTISAEAIVKGDSHSLSIAAASIIAKVTRDRIMVDLAQQYPGYGWDRNAGYPTKEHLAALRDLGVTPVHRRSFRPVHNILYQDKIISD